MKWSNLTIKKSLNLKFACGINVYKELLTQNLPFPYLRTLRMRMENLKFEYGILYEVFEFLIVKANAFNKKIVSTTILLIIH